MPTSVLDLIFDFMVSAAPTDIVLQEQTAKEMMCLALTQRNDRRHTVVVRARILLKMAADKRLQQWQERAWSAEARGVQELLAIDAILEQAGLDVAPSITVSVANLVRERNLYRDVLVNLVSRHPEFVDEVLALRSELRADVVSSDDEP